MAFSLNLPAPWPERGWKVKIRDRERLEPPHASILHRTRAWRLGLRTGTFLDKEPDPKEVPQALVDEVAERLPLLREAWDQMYPDNPVASEAECDD